MGVLSAKRHKQPELCTDWGWILLLQFPANPAMQSRGGTQEKERIPWHRMEPVNFLEGKPVFCSGMLNNQGSRIKGSRTSPELTEFKSY